MRRVFASIATRVIAVGFLVAALGAPVASGEPSVSPTVGVCYPLVAANASIGGYAPTLTTTPAPTPTTTPTPEYSAASFGGVVERSKVSICMGGETHYLQGGGVFLYSAAYGVNLFACEGMHVRVWGRMVPNPECEIVAVLRIQAFPPPMPMANSGQERGRVLH